MASLSPQVLGHYLTLVVFLIAAFVAVGREFWMARGLDKAYPLGRVSLAVPLAVFGAEHLTSAQAIMKLVPAWMPGKLFWTYFVGAALIAAALSFIFQVWIRVSAPFLGIMFAWTLLARESAFSTGAILLAIMISKPDVEALNYCGHAHVRRRLVGRLSRMRRPA